MSLEFNLISSDEYCTYITDGTHGTHSNQEYGKYLLSAKDILDGNVHIKDNSRIISEDDFNKIHKNYKLENYDVLLTVAGTIGRTAIIKNYENNYTFQRSVAIFKTNDKIKSLWLYYYLNSPIGKQIIKSLSKGTTQLILPLKDLRSLEIPVPKNIVDQKKILSVLTNIDKKIEINKRINKNLVTLAKTIFRDKFIFYKGYESQMIKTDVGEIPNTFEVKSVDEISKDVVCGKTPSTKVEENYGDNMPFITIPDMHGNVFVIDTERKLSEIGIKSQIKKILPENSICVSCIATAGLVSLTSEESQTNQQINSIICKEDISPYFVYLYMEELSEYIKMLGSGGSTTLNLNKREFGKIELVIPPQEDMIEFHGQISPLFEKIKSNQYEINFLMKLRDTLLPKLMSGEIDVSKINCDL